jgi:hypothetical protein
MPGSAARWVALRVRGKTWSWIQGHPACHRAPYPVRTASQSAPPAEHGWAGFELTVNELFSSLVLD